MTDEFLQKYKELEALVHQKHTVPNGDSALWVLGGLQEFVPFRKQITAVREIRNFLSHTPSYDGRPLLVPTESAVKILNNLITKLTGPSTVYNICVKPSCILTARMEDSIAPVIKLMTDKSFRIVPIMEGNKVVGVFEDSASIMYQMNSEGTDTTFYDLKKYIDIAQHINKTVLFLPKEAGIESAKQKIIDCFSKGHRINAIFITEAGKRDEAMLGLLLPLHLV